MIVSDAGIELVRANEGLSLSVYQDVVGKDTIGYGHLITDTERGFGGVMIGNVRRSWDEFNSADAITLLRQDLRKFEKVVNDFVTVPLTQSQFDALVSFAYNVGRSAFGASTLVKRLNKGAYDAIPTEMRKWNKADGKVFAGLVNRRKAEIQMWRA